MKSLFILSGLFSLALFGGIINARKDPGEYWQGVEKNEPMPEFIQGLVDESRVTSISTKENHCHTSIGSRNFEPRPNVSAYNDNSKQKEQKAYTKDFEPRPNVSSYTDDAKQTSFTKGFEPRPSATGYTDDDKLKEEEFYVKDFELRPNVTAYDDDAVGEEAKKTFQKDFQPQPNVSV